MRSTILRSHFLKDIIQKIWISSTKSWKMTCSRCNTTENPIFSLINCLPLSQYAVLPLRPAINMKVSYLRQNKHFQKDAAFIHFRLKESSENMIFPWNWNIQKLTKIWSFLPFSQIFVRQKFFFFMQCQLLVYINISQRPQ